MEQQLAVKSANKTNRALLKIAIYSTTMTIYIGDKYSTIYDISGYETIFSLQMFRRCSDGVTATVKCFHKSY